ncbi:MAG: hypothetical protein COU81_01785 [Candidatus Portnoybacteria bacterium CG10_big_fil_rev_8_21_14_0_10_36_7]|uniref:Uncharacterized protein n=1 Tax=Candidatus Portnoybacteria bacterium CG10_big_fil_rev_8_21_14_0_10_36_7 TaxID=1974812 RepID=A0A2M8KEA9_9BACT|nr:MAG: hypothetical protein COU81_01785 [Candidatus Portnoybacteria bacterium CG10_big_fil_rev_8_21_14_0_10_36_7]
MKSFRRQLTSFLRYSSILLPLLFFFLSIQFKDLFYLFISLVLIIVNVVIVFPSFLSNKAIRFPKFKQLKIITKENNAENKNSLKQIIEIKKFSVFVLVSTLYFSAFLIFNANQVSLSSNILLNHFHTLILSAKDNLLFFIGFPILAFFLFRNFRQKKHNLRFQFLTTLVILAISLILSFPVVFIFPIIEGNYFGVKFSSKNSSALSDPQKIADALGSLQTPPKVISTGDGFKEKILNTEFSSMKRSKFYKDKVVTKLSSKYIYTLKQPQTNLSLYKNFLFVKDLDKAALQKISPPLGKAFLKSNIDSSSIKETAEIKIVSRQEYLKLRDEQINKEVAEIDGIIKDISNDIAYMGGLISRARAEQADLQASVDRARSLREEDYQYCITAGYNSFYYGTFIRTYSDAECDAERREWDQTIANLESKIQEYAPAISQGQERLATLRYYKETYEAVRELIEGQKESAIQELGLFEPDKTLYVVLENVGGKELDVYLGTLVHEYLHFTSYISDERKLPRFFEEGLTEYFSRKVLRGNGSSQQIGYPIIVKIIEEVTKKIPEDELKRIYLAKDTESLKRSLNKAYGEKFYDDTEYFFDYLIWDFSSDKALKTANDIMFRIGGAQLTEADMESSL